MNFRKLSKMAKRVVAQRGGTEALKADAERLKGIARGQGTLSEKGRRAAEALRQPDGGGHGDPDRHGEAGHPVEGRQPADTRDRSERRDPPRSGSH